MAGRCERSGWEVVRSEVINKYSGKLSGGMFCPGGSFETRDWYRSVEARSSRGAKGPMGRNIREEDKVRRTGSGLDRRRM
jgi:hypothetical protein